MKKLSSEAKKRASKFGKIFLICMGVFVLISTLLMWRYAAIEAKKPETIGVTFSQVQAERFGSDWRANYSALLDDLHFKNLRIIAYWDRVESAPNQFDFSETDWMIEQAKMHNAKVTLVVGQRTLRYPECFYPNWLDRNNPKVAATEVNSYIKAVGEHYKNESTIEAWQLENEFLLSAFGDCPNKNLSSRTLNGELKTLTTADPNHPVVITASDEFGMPVFGPVADIYGFSMYKRVWNQLTHSGYFNYPQPGAFNWWRAAWISFIWRQEIKIHELQAEPWGPTGNENLDTTEAYKSMNPTQLARNIAYARNTKIKRFDLWGSEWWWYMKTTKNDSTMWEAVRNQTNL